MSNLDKELEKEIEESKKNLIFYIIGLIALLFYLHSLLYGDYSISIYLDAKDKESKLKQEYDKLQNENQKLQKKHFEMIQLTPEIDSY